MKKTKRGLFVTFEGGEGSGKSTLIAALESALTIQGFSVICTREPGGSALGDQIRQLLLHTSGNICDRAELLLFLASRSQHVEELIKPALALGKIVLCDRFCDSTIAYQGLARGLGESTVRELCRFSTENLMPDLTFLLDLEPEIGFQRLKNAGERNGSVDRIESEPSDFHQQVRRSFLAIASNEPQRIKIIDASLSKVVICDQVLRQITDFMEPII